MSINFMAYCLKCRKKVQIQDPKIVNLKGNRPAVKGRCPECKDIVSTFKPR